jgi:hypothetical protein
MSNCVVADMQESEQGTSNNSNEIQYITSVMVPCHSAVRTTYNMGIERRNASKHEWSNTSLSDRMTGKK